MTTTSFTGDDLERVLSGYEQQLATLRAALVETESSASCLMLLNETLMGETERLAGPAARQAKELWGMLDSVGRCLVEARDYVNANGAKGRHHTKVATLLAGADGDGPTIGELLDEAGRRHDYLRSWATRISEIWLEMLPRIDAARSTLGRLDRDVSELGVSEPLLAKVRKSVADLEQRLVGDPLSVLDADGEQLDADVGEAARQVGALRVGHDRLEHDMGDSVALLASLRVLRGRAAAVVHEVGLKIVDESPTMMVPSIQILDGRGALGEQLDEIVGLDQELEWSQRRFLLDNWLATANKLKVQLERALSVNSESLKRRDELRGRLTAYRAKMSAVGKAEDMELMMLADKARAELYTAPSDLGEATKAVEALIEKLRK